MEEEDRVCQVEVNGQDQENEAVVKVQVNIGSGSVKFVTLNYV
jgi:hypothetical protein